MRAVISNSSLHGEFTAPPSKSDLHRALFSAVLYGTETVINNYYPSDDINATVCVLRMIGANITENDGALYVKGVRVPAERKEYCSFDCAESGSTLRFLMPVSLLFFKKARFTGRGRLLSRPQSVYESVFTENGISYNADSEGITVSGTFNSGSYSLPGDISSQFLTGLMFALPLVGGGKIELTTELQSAPYVDMTISTLKAFGIEIVKANDNYIVPALSKLAKVNYTAEGDWSNAAFFQALKCMGEDIKINGLNNESYQGDKICTELFDKLKKGSTELDISSCPDLAPVLFAFAALNNGARFTGTARLRFKESDRAEAMRSELLKFGVVAVTDYNSFTVPENPVLYAPEVIISSHSDHRIAMAMAVICLKYGGTVDGCEAVKKSFPLFWKCLEKLDANILFE